MQLPKRTKNSYLARGRSQTSPISQRSEMLVERESNHVSGTIGQGAALSATLCHPGVVSTSGHATLCQPINTACCLTFARTMAWVVWQAACFLAYAMRNSMSQANTDAHRGRRLGMTDRGTAALELQAVLSLRLPALYRCALRFLGNAADAEDAVQEALLAAYKHIDQFRAKSRMPRG
jgi:Sigma-70 region 2